MLLAVLFEMPLSSGRPIVVVFGQNRRVFLGPLLAFDIDERDPETEPFRLI